MLLRKLVRTAWKYKAQFISMIIMVAIGVGVFFGFNMEWCSLERDIMSFLEETNYADYRIYSDSGFSADDIAAVKGIEGVDVASRVLAVDMTVKGEDDKTLSLFVSEDYTVSTFIRTSDEGCDYSADKEGFWLSDKYAAANGISVGDSLTLTYSSVELSGEVLGLIKSGEYLVCVAGDIQVMPDFNTYGFVYTTPRTVEGALGRAYFPQINIISELDKSAIGDLIDGALGKTTLLLSKDEHIAYAGAQSEIEEGVTMGSILPVLFLLIGILTMVTTMHRVAQNEKTQIGTLKALGFKDRRVLGHYTLYGCVIGIIGCIIGVGLGYGIAALVVNRNGMEGTYFDMPVWKLYVPWFCWLVLIATVVFLTLICYLSVKKMLKGTAAEALRPYTPKKMKPLALEKTKIWNRLSFSVKWNLRDTFRHKSRSLMTLIGIIGCTILLVGSLGMRDTVTAFLDVVETKTYNYETRVSFTETAAEEDIIKFAEDYEADLLAETSVRLDGNAVALEIYSVENDKMRFVDTKYREISLGDRGVYICSRLAENIAVGDYIEFSPYGSDRSYSVQVAGVVNSFVTENIVMTAAFADSIQLDYTYTAAFTDTAKAEIDGLKLDIVSSTQTKQSILQSYDSFMEIMNTMVLVLMLAAVILGVVVLYNLGIMNYMERYRELATLKVVGFKDRRIGRIIIEQNIWLTVLGLIIGIPAGVVVLVYLTKALASEYELKAVLGALTYVVSILLTFCISIMVSLLVARKNKRIDMVESLKGAE